MKILFSQAVQMQEAMRMIDERLRVAFWPDYRNQRGVHYPAHFAVYYTDQLNHLWLLWEPRAVHDEELRQSLAHLNNSPFLDTKRVLKACAETFGRDEHREEFLPDPVEGEAGKPVWVSELSVREERRKIAELQAPARKKVSGTRLASYFSDSALKSVCISLAQRLDDTLPGTITLSLQPGSSLMGLIAPDWQAHFTQDAVRKVDDDRVGAVVVPQRTLAAWCLDAGIHAAIVKDGAMFKLIIADAQRLLEKLGLWQKSFVVNRDQSIWLNNCAWLDGDDPWDDDDDEPKQDDDEEEED